MKKILILIICVLFCSCHSESVVIKEPSAIETRIAERNRWEAIAIFVQNHFDTGDKSISEIATDLSLASYYMEIEKAK